MADTLAWWMLSLGAIGVQRRFDCMLKVSRVKRLAVLKALNEWAVY